MYVRCMLATMNPDPAHGSSAGYAMTPVEDDVRTLIVIPDLRDELSKARRTPPHCLYCANPADSWEHPLPDALGGRLQAPILCTNHNSLLNVAADEPMIVEFQPLANMLKIKRQRGPHGSEFRGRTDAGERVTVGRDGHVRRFKLIEITKKGESGKLSFAKGDLTALERLRKTGAFEDPTSPILATVERPPIVNFAVAVSDEVWPGVLKIAFHFLASFSTDVDLETATAILPYLTGEQVAGGEYVRTMPLNGEIFPESWPPRHEIRSYPDGTQTFVTILLFGLYGFQVRLPIATSQSLRYSQPLVDSVAPNFERDDHVRMFTWETRIREDDVAALRANVLFRQEKIMGLARWRFRCEQCEAAAQRASISIYTYRIAFLDAYRAELQQEAFDSEEIATLLAFAKSAIASGTPVWHLPLEQFFS